MKLAKVCVYLLSLVLINSCSLSKAAKHLKEGETEQENYKVTLPFEIKNGFIIIPVEIENKNYNFLLDTGSPTLVSKELAASLNLKAIDSAKAGDVYNNKLQNKYTRLENVKIGNIDFTGTIALINDFNSVSVWSSLDIHGFIGANLMQHAIWDIDFRKKQITITDNESTLDIPEDVIENKLFIGVAGIPAIACKINGEKVWNFTVDLGYNGGIVVPFSEFKKQTENGEILDFKKSNTKGVTGIYGAPNTTRESFIGIIDEIEFGNSTLENVKVYSEQYLDKAFGSDFFKNYRIILNWNSKKIKMIENKSINQQFFSKRSSLNIG
ncbi:retropepsin-like aspartic protease [Salegentibacter maritimus]|uniref:retropepsin-like aspartic protease n=1 Tax=Salegentibacter maritimus TaxID=2794347 RepID=UPI0018E3FA8D|nr:retropepsin-like aspartic protease [Salegentibacter maritimus]MBI6115879.1 clan AA aspartic protease [Salegentibacter maritimus]